VDDNYFVLEMLVKQRLAEARAEAARACAARAHRGERVPLRVVTGRALVRLGARLGGTPAREPSASLADPLRS
jgi:hypothetical protein